MEISPIIKLLFWLTILAISIYHFIYWLIYVLKQRRAIKKYGESAIANIIDYKTTLDPDGQKIYCPVLEFTTKSGKRIVVDTEDGKLYKYKEDKQLKVFYLPNEPHCFYIAGSTPLQVFLLIPGIPVIIYTIYCIVTIASSL
jgi:hypothetical protein